MRLVWLLAAIGATIVSGYRMTNNTHNFEVLHDKELFPDHKLLVSDPRSLKIDKVKQISGYLSGVDDHQMFFWFFESRGNPAKDPTILWLNGGPGCSSLEGLFFENGPAKITEDYTAVNNPWSWNTHANVIFLDQPIGTGFSYGKRPVTSSPEASRDFQAFLNIFFKNYPQYKENFHIMGESYAGRYIPVFASDILEAKDLSFKLSSIAIGNGMIDPLTQYGDGYYGQMCQSANLNSRMCKSMLSNAPRCKQQIQNCYAKPTSRVTCVGATMACESTQLNGYSNAGLNPYDYTKKCEGNSGLCYADLEYLQSYLDQTFVKQALGARFDIPFKSCSDDVNRNFNMAGDWMQPFNNRFTAILNKIPVLIYAGDLDFICNWLGNQASVKNFEWPGKAGYNKASPKPWKSKYGHSGDVTNYKTLSFLRIFKAGHLVPYDKPRESLEMVYQWTKGNHAFT